MKRYIFAVTLAAFLLLGSHLWADPPVCPPFEGFLIETETDIEVYGNASETETFEWHWNNDACEGMTNGIGNDLQPLESVARIYYEEKFDSFNAYGGTGDLGRGLRGDPLPDDLPPTTYHKKLTADSNADENLVVEKDIGYTSDTEAGSHADLVEKVSVEVVSAGGAFQAGNFFAGILALCPWAPEPTDGQWPATNEGIAMGSMFDIDNVLANGDPGNIDFSSDTVASVTDFVALSYVVDATGSGKIQAEMIAKLWEGSAAGTDPGTPLNSELTYTETSMAEGIFTFHKGMNYRARFEPPEPTPIGLDILAP